MQDRTGPPTKPGGTGIVYGSLPWGTGETRRHGCRRANSDMFPAWCQPNYGRATRNTTQGQGSTPLEQQQNAQLELLLQRQLQEVQRQQQIETHQQ